MKKFLWRITTWCLLVMLLTANAYAGSVFPDVDDNADYAEAVEYLNEIGIMQGDEKGNFNPNKAVSRAEMAVLICRVLEESENLTTAKIFTDVPASHWANGYIARAASLGIISGYGDGRFGPDDMVTYEQAATIIVRAAEWDEDIDILGGYPEGYLAIAEGHQLLDGVAVEKGQLLPRAYVATMLFNYYNPPFLFD